MVGAATSFFERTPHPVFVVHVRNHVIRWCNTPAERMLESIQKMATTETPPTTSTKIRKLPVCLRAIFCASGGGGGGSGPHQHQHTDDESSDSVRSSFTATAASSTVDNVMSVGSVYNTNSPNTVTLENGASYRVERVPIHETSDVFGVHGGAGPDKENNGSEVLILDGPIVTNEMASLLNDSVFSMLQRIVSAAEVQKTESVSEGCRDLGEITRSITEMNTMMQFSTLGDNASRMACVNVVSMVHSIVQKTQSSCECVVHGIPTSGIVVDAWLLRTVLRNIFTCLTTSGSVGSNVNIRWKGMRLCIDVSRKPRNPLKFCPHGDVHHMVVQRAVALLGGRISCKPPDETEQQRCRLVIPACEGPPIVVPGSITAPVPADSLLSRVAMCVDIRQSVSLQRYLHIAMTAFGVRVVEANRHALDAEYATMITKHQHRHHSSPPLSGGRKMSSSASSSTRNTHTAPAAISRLPSLEQKGSTDSTVGNSGIFDHDGVKEEASNDTSNDSGSMTPMDDSSVSTSSGITGATSTGSSNISWPKFTTSSLMGCAFLTDSMFPSATSERKKIRVVHVGIIGSHAAAFGIGSSNHFSEFVPLKTPISLGVLAQTLREQAMRVPSHAMLADMLYSDDGEDFDDDDDFSQP